MVMTELLSQYLLSMTEGFLNFKPLFLWPCRLSTPLFIQNSDPNNGEGEVEPQKLLHAVDFSEICFSLEIHNNFRGFG